MEALTKALEAGFKDKDKTGELLLAASPSSLKEIQALLVEKEVLTSSEAEDILAGALDE
jgi:hypothetical protein